MEIGRFVRKPFEVEGVQVTEENLQEVATWCGGDIRRAAKKYEPGDEPYIKVRVARAINERQTQAFVGDWVLRAETGFKVYTPHAMEKSFESQAPAGTHRNVFEDQMVLEFSDPDPNEVAVRSLTPEEVLRKENVLDSEEQFLKNLLSD